MDRNMGTFVEETDQQRDKIRKIRTNQEERQAKEKKKDSKRQTGKETRSERH